MQSFLSAQTGYLCGDCRDGKGVSALLNHCVDCSNAYGILIGVLGKLHSSINCQQVNVIYLYSDN